jgi:hypothetical protein
VSENRGLRRIFETKRDKVSGDWRKLQNEELHNWYAFPTIIMVIKLRWMRWDTHIVGIHDTINTIFW